MRPQTAELLYQLLEDDRRTRERALLQLIASPDPDACDELIRLAERSGPIGDERALAFRAIATCLAPGQAAALRFLYKNRRDADPFIRAAAISGLGRLQDDRLEPALREAFADADPLVRQSAHEALRAAAARNAQPGSPSPSAAAAGIAGGEASPGPNRPASAEQQRLRSLLGRLEPGGGGSWEEVARQLAGLGGAVLGLLLAELANPEAKVRMAVSHALGLLGDRRALDALLTRLRPQGERDLQVVPLLLRAAAALLRPGDTTHLDTLREYALPVRRGVANDHFVRAAALDALARIPDPRSAAALLAACRDGDEWVRATASRALPLAIPESSPELLPTLAEMLNHDPVHAEELVGLLLALKKAYPPGGSIPPGLRRRVRDLLNHAESAVREAALWVVDALLAPTGTSPPPPDDEWLSTLVERVSDQEGEVRRHALELLADVAPQGYAPAAAPARELARSSDPALARPALRLLGRVGDLASVETIIAVAESASAPLAREAGRLLEQLSGPIRVERGEDGRLAPVLVLSCACGQRPTWRSDPLGRELLNCPGCGASYLLTASGALTAVATLPLGICRCCRRPAALERDAGGRLRCSATLQVHLRHPATGMVYALDRLPYGGCGCCREPVPLFEVDARVYCPITGRTHERNAQGVMVPQGAPRAAATADADARPAGSPASGRPLPPTVEEVNRALLEGSLLLTQSGLPVLNTPPPGEPPGSGRGGGQGGR